MRKLWIFVGVAAAIVLAVGVGLLTWFLVRSSGDKRFGAIDQHAAFTTIPDAGEMFSWYYPTQAEGVKPVILWLHGVTELAPSLSANIGAFGPYDKDLNRREDSWVDELNLLFVDAPLGTGFSTITDGSNLARSPKENAEHLLLTLNAFYAAHPEVADSPLFIFGQGHGAQLALALALRLQNSDAENISRNLKGVALGNPIINPALVMTKLGLYLEEFAYVGDAGRPLIETYAAATQALVSSGQYSGALTSFLALNSYVNTFAGAVAINIRNIVEKQTRTATNTMDYFGQELYLNKVLETDVDMTEFMENEVAPALGISGRYNAGRDSALNAMRPTYMQPAEAMLEDVLQNTNLVVTIYNGNLDAISNIPGQLEWIEKLQWDGQQQFLDAPRLFYPLNGILEGAYRSTERLRFYWLNAAGQAVPLDSPVAMKDIALNVTLTYQ